MQWHRIWNGNLVNLEHISQIELHEYQGGGRTEISGTMLGGGTVILAKCPDHETAQEALNRFMEDHNWNSLPEELTQG